MTPAVLAATVLAQGDDDFGAGFIAFVVVMALAVAAFFLFRSMNRHLRSVPDEFPVDQPDDVEPPRTAGPGGSDDPRGT